MVFPEPVNLTGIPELLTYANTVTNGWYGVAIIISLYFVVLLILINRGEFFLDAMVLAGWIGILGCGISFYVLSLLSVTQFVILLVIFAGSVAFSYAVKSG